MTDHRLNAGVTTCQWGFFDAEAKPVLRIKSGDRVTIDSVSGNALHMPPADKFNIPAALLEIHAKASRVPARTSSPVPFMSRAPSPAWCWRSRSRT